MGAALGQESQMRPGHTQQDRTGRRLQGQAVACDWNSAQQGQEAGAQGSRETS